nr:hypothetical protein CFP56_05785 [Quercus suber]
MERAAGSSGPNREIKRKLSPLRILDRAQVEEVIHRIGKESVNQAQVISAQGLKLKENKMGKARNGAAHIQRNSVKGMKELARDKASRTHQISAAEKGGTKALNVVQSQETREHTLMSDRAVHNPSSSAGDFKFAAVAESGMGQLRKGETSEIYGERVGREACKPILSLAQEGVEEECERGGADSIRTSMDYSENLVGFPGGGSGTGEGIQEADTGTQSGHYSSSDGNGGLAACGTDQMDFEGERDVGSSL